MHLFHSIICPEKAEAWVGNSCWVYEDFSPSQPSQKVWPGPQSKWQHVFGKMINVSTRLQRISQGPFVY